MKQNMLAVVRWSRSSGSAGVATADIHLDGHFDWPLSVSSVAEVRQQCAKRLDTVPAFVVILNIIRLADSPELQPGD